MRISELQELLGKAKEEYGDVDILFKDSYSGYYRPKKIDDFEIRYSPVTVEHYHITLGYQLFVE